MSIFDRARSPRAVAVDALARDPNLLVNYPFRYALLYAGGYLGRIEQEAADDRRIEQLFWAVELLEAQGWDPVAWDLQGRNLSAVVRRRQLPPHAPYTNQPPVPQ